MTLVYLEGGRKGGRGKGRKGKATQFGLVYKIKHLLLRIMLHLYWMCYFPVIILPMKNKRHSWSKLCPWQLLIHAVFITLVGGHSVPHVGWRDQLCTPDNAWPCTSYKGSKKVRCYIPMSASSECRYLGQWLTQLSSTLSSSSTAELLFQNKDQSLLNYMTQTQLKESIAALRFSLIQVLYSTSTAN